MKKILLILLCLPMIGISQQNPPPAGQAPATAQEWFDINGVKTILGPAAFMWDLNDAQYEVPKGLGKHSIFAHEYWFGGVDDGGQLRVAAQTYRQGGNDFWAGPVSDSSYHNPNYMSVWDRVWKINKTEIDSHIVYYNSGGYVIPDAIENWPAHGDTTLGQAFYLAPFVDTDNNGVYNASLGDYPDIKGDQTLYIIRNDVGNIHTETEAEPIGIEQHIMFYGYECHDNPAIHHTLFVNMKVYNRRGININDFYAGTWLDPDLGWYLDDYIGCNVGKNLGYVYNGVSASSAATSYSNICGVSNQLSPPAQGLVYLNDTMSTFQYYNNDFTVTGNPNTGTHYYNYLRGIWKDNVPMTYGGNGKGSGPGATTNLCNYMFPDTTDPNFPAQAWTEVTAGNIAGNRRFLMSAGPIDLDSGGVYTLDYAFVFAWDSVTPGNTASLNLLFDYVDDVKAVYQNPGILECNILGCTDPTAVNYNPNATLDDGSCCYLGGCTDMTAVNYDPNALCNDGSCTYIGVELRRIEGTGNGGVALGMKDQTVNDILSNTDHRTLHPTYRNGQGPVNITVVDSINITPGEYIFKLNSPIYTGNNITSYGGWSIIDSLGNIVDSSNQSITIGITKHIPQLGIQVSVKQQVNPGDDPLSCDGKNGFIYSSIEFDNPADKWLSGVPDKDDEYGFFWGLNWIRAGTYQNNNNGQLSDYSINDDPNGIYETVVEQTTNDSLLFGGTPFTGGTWAPYHLTSTYKDGPGYSNSTTAQTKMADLHSVDIVFTSDQSKWSKCVVVEANEDNSNFGGDPLLAVGGQIKMGLRLTPSIDQNGNPLNDGTMGMSWFPGYAINLETGERLNIIFSEDSRFSAENGDDLIWNPTSNIIDSLPIYDPQTGTFSGGNYLLGGKHYIYVINGSAAVKKDSTYLNGAVSPNYDECAWIYNQLKNYTSQAYVANIWQVFRNAAWVGAPLLTPGSSLLTNDATVRIRVTKPYNQYVTRDAQQILDKNDNLTIGTTYFVMGANLNHNSISYSPGDIFTAVTTSFSGSSNARAISPTPLNGFNPMYSFNISNNPSPTNIFHIEQEEGIFKVNIYPNPTNARVNIHFYVAKTQNIKLKLLSAIGEIIFIENLNRFKGEYSKQINLKDYPKAIYFLEIETQDGVINKKLILQ